MALWIKIEKLCMLTSRDQQRSRKEISMINILDKLLTPIEVSKHLGISVETLNTWRATNRYNLPYVKVGRLVRYRIEDIQTFLNSRIQTTTT